MYLKNRLDFEVLASREQTQDWIDPIIGAEVLIDLTNRWCVTLHGDIGGFGTSADLTWSAVGDIGYRFHLNNVQCVVFAGYKALGEDYTEGSGDREFAWDTVSHGPMFGARFTF